MSSCPFPWTGANEATGRRLDLPKREKMLSISGRPHSAGIESVWQPTGKHCVWLFPRSRCVEFAKPPDSGRRQNQPKASHRMWCFLRKRAGKTRARCDSLRSQFFFPAWFPVVSLVPRSRTGYMLSTLRVGGAFCNVTSRKAKRSDTLLKFSGLTEHVGPLPKGALGAPA